MNLSVIALAAAAGLFAASAHAATVFKNGVPDGQGGLIISADFEGADFKLDATRTLTGATLLLTSSDPDGTPVRGASIDYQLWSDGPDGPAALLQSGEAENLRYRDADLPHTTFLKEISTAFDFRDPFEAQAGTTYWLVVHALDGFDNRSIEWSMHRGVNGLASTHSEDDVHWSSHTDPFDVDFSLQDATPGGAPEPAAWTLMIGGFGLAGAALRRRRAVAEPLRT